VKFKTVAYKGSKRKLLNNIKYYAEQVDAKTFFDGFSGTGIVSANMRSCGYTVTANDLNHSSYLYGRVFLNGFNPSIVGQHIEIMNNLQPLSGWLTENYSGERERVIRGTGGKKELRPKGYIVANAMKIDAAREYVESLLTVNEHDKDALIFSVVTGADRVFNNSNDQKSSLKRWSPSALKEVRFVTPTLIVGPIGKQLMGDITTVDLNADIVYLDPPYTHGVLYASCYHLNDSIAKWNKPTLDESYAIPRPVEVCFRKNKKNAGGFYNKKSAPDSFDAIIGSASCSRLLLSYSDAPRNVLTITQLVDICRQYGKVQVESFDHKICMQPNQMNKISSDLKEFFIVLDKK